MMDHMDEPNFIVAYVNHMESSNGNRFACSFFSLFTA